MIIIGEKLNSSIPKTFEIMKSGDKTEIIRLAEAQAQAGASYLDINTAMFGEEELSKLKDTIDLVKSVTKCGIMIDSTNVDTVAEAAEYCGGDMIINSVTLYDRMNELLPVIKKHGTGVVALPIDKNGTPKSAAGRLENAMKLIEVLKSNAVSEDKIYIDVLAEAAATDDQAARVAIDTAMAVRRENKNVHITCGLSNVSFGLPKRKILNRSYFTMLRYAGLDSAIMDPLTEDMQQTMAAVDLMLGEDEFCMNYITVCR